MGKFIVIIAVYTIYLLVLSMYKKILKGNIHIAREAITIVTIIIIVTTFTVDK